MANHTYNWVQIVQRVGGWSFSFFHFPFCFIMIITFRHLLIHLALLVCFFGCLFYCCYCSCCCYFIICISVWRKMFLYVFCSFIFLKMSCDSIFELFLYVFLCEQFAVFKLYTDFEVQLVFRNICNNKFTDVPNNQV